jgi:UDP-glucose 4-epimerase
MSVYGDHIPPECDEGTELCPKSFYAVGKIASEHYMRIYAQSYGITCTALRLFNTYGVGQNMKNLKQGMASIYMAMAIKDRKIVVKGSKDRFRDFVYIDDVVDAFIKSLNRDEGYDCFNVCTGVATKVEDVVSKICTNLPYDVDVEYVLGTPGDQFGIYGNNQKIFNSLGWKPAFSFDKGIAMMTKWAMENC